MRLRVEESENDEPPPKAPPAAPRIPTRPAPKEVGSALAPRRRDLDAIIAEEDVDDDAAIIASLPSIIKKEVKERPHRDETEKKMIGEEWGALLERGRRAEQEGKKKKNAKGKAKEGGKEEDTFRALSPGADSESDGGFINMDHVRRRRPAVKGGLSDDEADHGDVKKGEESKGEPGGKGQNKKPAQEEDDDDDDEGGDMFGGQEEMIRQLASEGRLRVTSDGRLFAADPEEDEGALGMNERINRLAR